ncbi:MAG: helix-turn-helix domain-containing protein [Acidimicrobiales bacterium]
MAQPTVETIGNLVRRYRGERHWSRRKLGQEVNRSMSWVSKVEDDTQAVHDIHMLGRLAVLLGAPLAEFIDAALGPEAGDAVRERPYVEQVRRAIAGHPVPDSWSPGAASSIAAIDMDDLGGRTRRAWELVHASSYQALGPLLARLISNLEVVSRVAVEPERTMILVHLADVYQVAAAMLVKVGDHGAGWVAADRAIAAGERCNDRGLVLAGQLRMARTLLNSRERALARHVLEQGKRMAKDAVSSGDPGLISLVGACALLLGILDALEHKSQPAADNLAMAVKLANTLGSDRNEYGTEFGPTNVAMHAVAMSVELGNGQQAVDRTRHVPAGTLSPERQARYLIDVARAHVLARSPRDAISALLQAEQVARVELADLPMVAVVIEDIEGQVRRGQQQYKMLRELKYRLYG